MSRDAADNHGAAPRPSTGMFRAAGYNLLDGCHGWLLRGPLKKMFAPSAAEYSWFHAIVGRIFVTPLTNITGLSLHYQLYLDLIFHRGLVARLGHYSTMPFVVWFWMAWMAQWHIGSGDASAAYGCITGEGFLNAALVFAIILIVWYLIWGIVSHEKLLCVLMVFPVAIMWALATVYYQLTREPDSSRRHWYQPSENAAANPFMWMWIFAFLQSLSHALEPQLPPRVNGTTHWMDFKVYKDATPPCEFWTVVLSQSVFGALDEWMASPRLLPLFWLKNVYGMGYREGMWRTVQQLAQLAIDSGDPALDYIGIGGGDYFDHQTRLILTRQDPKTGNWVIVDKNNDPEHFQKAAEKASRIRNEVLQWKAKFDDPNTSAPERQLIGAVLLSMENTINQRDVDQQTWAQEGEVLDPDFLEEEEKVEGNGEHERTEQPSRPAGLRPEESKSLMDAAEDLEVPPQAPEPSHRKRGKVPKLKATRPKPDGKTERVPLVYKTRLRTGI